MRASGLQRLEQAPPTYGTIQQLPKQTFFQLGFLVLSFLPSQGCGDFEVILSVKARRVLTLRGPLKKPDGTELSLAWEQLRGDWDEEARKDCGETGWKRDGWLKILAMAGLLKATRPMAQQVAASSPVCRSPTSVWSSLPVGLSGREE